MKGNNKMIKKLLVTATILANPVSYAETVYDIRLQHVVDKNYAKSLSELESKATADNDSDAYNLLGEIYHFGWGVTTDYTKAHAYYLKATALGNGIAANHLGRLYLNGEGVTKDPKKAAEYYGLAKQYGLLEGAQNEAYCFFVSRLQDPKESKIIREQLEIRSDADALNLLGEIYHFGWGVTTDYTKAHAYYLKAVALRNGIAAIT
jgi:TPR repeat protein